MIPLYGFLKGDTLGLLILAYKDDTIEQLGEKLRQAARVRVASRPILRVSCEGKELPLTSTVGRLNLKPLERFDVELSGGQDGL